MREIDDLVAKPEKYLATAETTLNGGDYDSCVSRCYYAMFFMAEAVLLTRGLKAASHKGVISLFGQQFVKPGIFSKELGKALKEAHDKRQIGDYGVGFTISREEAKGTLITAKLFVDAVKSSFAVR
jgi:uncharacterized protein (UPF0332 family)